MKKRQRQVLAVLAMAGMMLLAGCQGGGVSTEKTEKKDLNQEVVIVNELNGEVFESTFKEVPTKAVSLSGFMTEMFLSLGLEDNMAGYGYQDNEVLPQYKEALAKVEEISKTENPSKEVLLSKEPDFMTGWNSTFSEKNFSKEFCDENGIQIYIPKTEKVNAKMEDVYEDFLNMGKIFNVEKRAEEIVTNMKSKIEDISTKVKDTEKVKVFIFDSGEEAPFTASAGLPTDMINLAGGENIFGGNEKNWMEVSWEDVISKNPQIIIIMDYDASNPASEKEKFLLEHPGLQSIDAIKNKKIYTLGLSDVLAGERDVQTIEKMAEWFHPDQMK